MMKRNSDGEIVRTYKGYVIVKNTRRKPARHSNRYVTVTTYDVHDRRYYLDENTFGTLINNESDTLREAREFIDTLVTIA
jgi:hypothetical protein